LHSFIVAFILGYYFISFVSIINSFVSFIHYSTDPFAEFIHSLMHSAIVFT